MSLTHTSDGRRRPRSSASLSGLQDNFPGLDYDKDEIEFMFAMDHYKRDNRRPHPSWREVLHVLKSLGYEKKQAQTK